MPYSQSQVVHISTCKLLDSCGQFHVYFVLVNYFVHSRCSQVFPNCIKAHIHMGRANLGLKEYDKARECYKKALECEPKNETMIKGRNK